MKRYILHVDMDAFFASVEQRDNPDLRNKPVIIGANPRGGGGRGVVSTCSYAARKFGVCSSMPISIAYRKCPHGVFLPVRMKKYQEVSLVVQRIFYEFTPLVEMVSIDEAFLDISGSYHIFKTPLAAAIAVQQRIKDKTGLTASVGLAPNKAVAKIASDMNKPEGLTEVKHKEVTKFLTPLDVEKIWGLGRKSTQILNKMGINTIGQLDGTDIRVLHKAFGKNAYRWQKLARGKDDSQVEASDGMKSLSNEITFEKDTQDIKYIEGALMNLSEKVSFRLRKSGLKSKTITLKIRLEGFQTYSRSVTISNSTNFSDTIYKIIKKLFGEFWLSGRKIRLLGVRLTNFVGTDDSENIFQEPFYEKKKRICMAVDKMKNKFGSRIVYRATAAGFRD